MARNGSSLASECADRVDDFYQLEMEDAPICEALSFWDNLAAYCLIQRDKIGDQLLASRRAAQEGSDDGA